MLKDSFHLRSLDPWKPFQEIIHRGTIFQVRKKSLDRDTGASKEPGTADLGRVLLYGGAGAPVHHASIID
jgi:hypothetical protein